MEGAYSGTLPKQKTLVISARTPGQLTELYQFMFNNLGIRATSILHRGICSNQGVGQHYSFSVVFLPETRELAVGDGNGIPSPPSVKLTEREFPSFYRNLLKLTSYENPKPYDSPLSTRMSFIGEQTTEFYPEETRRAHLYNLLKSFTETEDLHERHQRAESGRFGRFG